MTRKFRGCCNCIAMQGTNCSDDYPFTIVKGHWLCAECFQKYQKGLVKLEENRKEATMNEM